MLLYLVIQKKFVFSKFMEVDSFIFWPFYPSWTFSFVFRLAWLAYGWELVVEHQLALKSLPQPACVAKDRSTKLGVNHHVCVSSIGVFEVK
jgi:hypothetical protein